MGQNTNRGIYLIVRLTVNKLQCKRGQWVSFSKSGCCGFSDVSSASSLLAALHEVWLSGSVRVPQPSRALVLGFLATTRETSMVLQAASSLVWTSAPVAQLSLGCLLYMGLVFLWGKKPWGGADNLKSLSRAQTACAVMVPWICSLTFHGHLKWSVQPASSVSARLAPN